MKKGNSQRIASRFIPIIGICVMSLLFSACPGFFGIPYHKPLEDPFSGPAAGNPGASYALPPGAGAEDSSHPDHVVGTGTPKSCTAKAFIEAVAQGGVITFNSGGKPVVIEFDSPAKVFNDKPDLVIDGGGLVALSGGGKTRILYMNTCDKDQVWTSERCDNQEHPRLCVQNLIFCDGDSTGEGKNKDGGGAIFASGGRFKAVNCRFFNNACAKTGQDLGGGAIRVFQQYGGQPAYVVNCTFGGKEGFGNFGSNGGALSSIGVSWTIVNSLFANNYNTGNGGNPGNGGCGGAIYNDGNTMTLSVLGSLIENNKTTTFGSAIFFVSNDHSGNIVIADSTIRRNSGGSWYPVYPGISMHEDTSVSVSNSTIEE
jgi:hypothetical protein